MIEQAMETLRVWLVHTKLADMMGGRWEWPIAESLHYMGLSMLLGTVGLFDLRMLGIGKRIPIVAFHKLVPWGIAGYFLNVLTGIAFFTTAPDQYMYNPAFQTKLIFMGIAGINVLVFYSMVYREVKVLGTGASAPLAAKIIGGVSFVCWIGVITCGRLITFYRPPWRWCPWC
jgi:hypothetical protein